MKPILLFIFVACFQFEAFMQNGLEDWSIKDLEERLIRQGLDTPNKVETYNELAFKYRKTNRDSALWAAHQALKLAKKIDYPKGEGDAWVRLGLIARRAEKIDSAEYYYLQALDIRKVIGSKQQQAGLFNNLANLFKNDLEKAVEYYEKALLLLEEVPLTDQKARILNNLGDRYRQFGDYPKALFNLSQAVKIREQLDNKSKLAPSYLALGILSSELSNNFLALDYFNKSLQLYQQSNNQEGITKNQLEIGNAYYKLDSLNKALAFYKLVSENRTALDKNDQILLEKNFGSVYSKLGNKENALIIYEKSLLKLAPEAKAERADINFNIGLIHFKTEQFDKALSYFQKTELLMEHIIDPTIKNQLPFYLSATHSKLNQPEKALVYMNQYTDAKTNRNLVLQNTLNDQINLLNENIALQIDAKQKFQRTMITYGILAFCILFGVAGAIVYFNEQKKQMAFLRIDELLIEKERAANYARLEEQEKERNRIAQDLHDRLGSMLSVIKLSIGSIDAKVDQLHDESRKHYQKASNLIDEACDEVRNISHNLKNSILAKFGLKAALESLVNSLQGNALQVELNTHNLDNRLANKIEINVFRIIQELVSNTLKHAKATKLSIQVNHFDDILNVTVEDNGIGFKPNQVNEKSAGLGLHHIEARVHDMEGSINIDSGKGNGTTIMIDIPR